MSNKDRIISYLNDENCSKTPQEISEWTKISLREVYEILQSNKLLFQEVLDEDSLKGWKVDNIMASPYSYNIK